MSDQLQFDGRVAIVTGAGGGLGRAHALLLASRGAAVVVNDLGGNIDGTGSGKSLADSVVEEIKAAGGEATANYDSVEDGDKIVQTALDNYKRIDIVINNAGILRDKSYHKMSDEDWDLIYRVHVLGAYKVTKAAWPHLRDQQYGRVVMTASAAGIYGNFGQANYSMAKLGLTGFAYTLAREGHTKNVFVNTIAPVAGSRLTETVMPPELIEALKPEYVSPLVAWLCHEDCQENGGLFEVGAGWFAKLRWQRTKGLTVKLNQDVAIETIRDRWDTLADWTDADNPESVQESMGPAVANLQSAKEKVQGNEHIDPGQVLAFKFTSLSRTYDERDLSIYALGIGASRDPLDQKELQFVYENHSDGFKAFPTYGVTFPFDTLAQIMTIPALKFNPMMLLHGEQYLELKRTLPTSATISTDAKIGHIYDKGKGAVLTIESETRDENGEVLAIAESTVFIRGIGNFGGDRGPAATRNDPPSREPDAIHEEKIDDNQALLYRLSGDRNPLHADPAMASMGGFDRPILHGLCFFGFAARAVLKHFCDNDPARFKSIRVRFAKHVFPGETLITEMWKEGDNTIIFRCKVAERDEFVLTHAAVVTCDPSDLAPPKPAAAAKPGNGSPVAAVFEKMQKRIAEKPELVAKVGAVFQFDVSGEGGGTWAVDLKNGSGSVQAGAAEKADCTIAMDAEDFLGLMSGKLDGQQAFMAGKLKVSGDTMLATKLNLLQG